MDARRLKAEIVEAWKRRRKKRWPNRHRRIETGAQSGMLKSSLNQTGAQPGPIGLTARMHRTMYLYPLYA
jgi:hypothetical protein